MGTILNMKALFTLLLLLGTVWTKSPVVHNAMGNNNTETDVHKLVQDTELQDRSSVVTTSGNKTEVDVLDKELQDRSSVVTCVECVTTIASTVTSCALAGDACAVVACVQDQIGPTNDCYDCVCFAVGTIVGTECDTCSGGSLVSVSCILYIFLAFLTMKLYELV